MFITSSQTFMRQFFHSQGVMDLMDQRLHVHIVVHLVNIRIVALMDTALIVQVDNIPVLAQVFVLLVRQGHILLILTVDVYQPLLDITQV